MIKNKKRPLRKCVSCDLRKEKKDLIRVVKNKDNEVSVDRTGKSDGRGAYICRDVSCLEKTRKTKRLNRALKIDIPNEVFDSLIKEIKKDE